MHIQGRSLVKHLRTLFLSLCISVGATSALQAASSYECAVTDFLNFSADQDFITRNLQKRYMITIGDEQVFVTMLSEHFSNSQTIFQIVNRPSLPKDVYAVNLSSVAIDTLAFSESYFEGSYQATIATQAPLYVSVWKLACQKP